jgi:hypothetical protein
MSKTIYLDTNLFLHYQPFDQINWPKVVNTDTVTIVFPPITIRELNNHKELHPRAHIKKRAGEAIKRLFKLFDSDSKAEISEGISVYFEDRDPIIDFSAYQLNLNVQDDHLIASILMSRQEAPTDSIVLVTSDFGLTLLAKAGRLGIDTLRMPDSYRILDKPDPNEIKIKQLEQQIRELNSRVPQPDLTYEDGLQHATFKLPKPVDFDHFKVDEKLAELKKKFPLQEFESPETELQQRKNKIDIAALVAASSIMGTISPEEIDRYNSEVEQYIPVYTTFLLQNSEFENLKKRAIQIKLVLVNGGSAPAEDIDIYMHFPDGFRVLEEHELPNPPKPPVKPMTGMQKLNNSLNYSNSLLQVPYLGSYDHSQVVLPSNVSGPDIKRTNSYNVHVHVQKIKHNLQVSLDPLFIVFDSFESASSFAIEYSILAANIPHEITGNLHVIIEKDT